MAGVLEPAVAIFSGGISGNLWILMTIVVIAIVGAVIWWVSKYKKKDSQWTHKLNVRIELANGDIDEKVIVHKMRRWKHKDQRTPPLFELEKALLGSRIFVELERYIGATTYEIILGNDGRLYLPNTTKMDRDANALNVSVKHAGIDRARQQYSDRFEQMNATPSKIDVLTLLKYGMYATAIIVFLILGIMGIKAWGERASYDAAEAELELRSWELMQEVSITQESLLNTLILIIPDLKELYGNNIQNVIKDNREELNQTI